VTFPLTTGHLLAAGVPPRLIDVYLSPLTLAMMEFEIDTGERPAMFLAQVAHESNNFRSVEEYWGPNKWQLKYPDGQRFKGRGLIQITGRKNYESVAAQFGLELDDVATWLMTPLGACRGSAWWWSANGCNEIADRYDMVALTRRINGPGMLGLEDRVARYKAISEVVA
jgi:putative chitinase